MEKIAGVIAEYNPFHNGHAYQFEQIRKCGADAIVVCMSGNFVQRCEPAVLEKHNRALSAVENGADLVLELPFPYSLLSAEGFASAGVHLLSASGVVTDLYFGCESAKTEDLLDAYSALCRAEESGKISQLVKTGLSFPRARAGAMKSAGARFVPEKPNDILAFEYVKAIFRQKSSLRPVSLPRIGDYLSEAPCGEFLSASGIRSRLFSGGEISRYLPESSYLRLLFAKKDGTLVKKDALDRLVLSGLIRKSLFLENRSAEGLENRIFAAMERCFSEGDRSLDSVCRAAGSKRVALSSVRRKAYSLFFEIPEPVSPPGYLHVLAFNRRGRELLRRMKNKASLPVYHTLPADRKRFSLELLSDEIYFLLSGDPSRGINGFTANSLFFEENGKFFPGTPLQKKEDLV